MTILELETIRIPLSEGYRIVPSDVSEGLLMKARWAIEQLDGLSISYQSWADDADYAGIRHMLDPNGTLRKFFSLLATYPRFTFEDGREESVEPKYLEPPERPLVCRHDKPRSVLETSYTTYAIPKALKALDGFLTTCGSLSAEARRIAVSAHVLVGTLVCTCSTGPHAPHPIAWDDLRTLADLCEQLNVEIMVREVDAECGGTDVAEAVSRQLKPALKHIADVTESLSGQITNTNRNVLRLRKESQKEQAQIRQNTVRLLKVEEVNESLVQDDPKAYESRATGVELDMLDEVFELVLAGKMNASCAAERVFRDYQKKKVKFTFKNVSSFKTQAYRYCKGQMRNR